LNILHVIPKFTISPNGTVIGGAANSLFNLARCQAKEHEVCIMSFFPAYIPTKDELCPGLTFSPISMQSKSNSVPFGLEFIIRTSLLAKKQKGTYDIIHGHSGHIDYILSFALLSKLLNLPLVYSLNCPVILASQITKFPGRRKLLSTLTTQVDRFIAISKNVLNSMQSVGIQNHRVNVIPLAVDINKFAYVQDPEKYRNSHNLSYKTPIFLFVGSVAPTKNLETVLIAFNKVLKKLPTANLIITTELKLDRYEERAAYLSRLIDEMQLQNNVVQMGVIDNMQEVMASADLLLAPFRSTDGPSDYFLAALEAMSVGRPVIVSPVGGMLEIVDDEVGVIVSAQDALQLADAMTSLAVNKECRIEMGKRATKRIREKFDPKIISDSVDNVYSEVIRNAF
jgi:glycosyltransferase involved in cell wall biosynthesis